MDLGKSSPGGGNSRCGDLGHAGSSKDTAMAAVAGLRIRGSIRETGPSHCLQDYRFLSESNH